MIEEEGVVAEVTGGLAKVAVLKKSACEQCAASGVCHPGDQDYLEAANPLGAKKGQKVKVVLAPQVYLKASIILYGIPMVALVGGAILGKNAALHFGASSSSDLWAFVCGALCMTVSFFFIRSYNKKVEKTQQYKPVIVEILTSTASPEAR
ncbi:MAG TPA: SoxR reducing system RseC family protein [Nitrospirota bacterium]|nr:SoxR reducing system RseC family protein [Nitrospirota bacterium]